MVVSNSSPLVYFAALSDFELLRQIFRSICIPHAVYEEVVLRGAAFPVREAVLRAKGDWIRVVAVQDTGSVGTVAEQNKLGSGETEAIVLYGELDARLLLVDEQRAVRYARQSGIQVARTPMIYATAQKRGLIANLAEKLDNLRRVGFWLKDEDYDAIVRELGGK